MKATFSAIRRNRAERKTARRSFRDTRQLDAHILRDIGLIRDEFHGTISRI